MKQLPLTKGKFAFVDDDDYYWVSQWNWCAIEISGTVYARRSIKKGNLRSGEPFEIYLHRVVMRCTDKNLIVDHRDHDGLNCQKSNLRICTKAENNQNITSQKRSQSRYLGVTPENGKWRRQKWRAQLVHKGKRVLNKRFVTEEAAAKAYDEAAKKHFGEFANLNFK